MDIFEFILCIFKFWPQLFDYFSAIFNLFLQVVIVLLFENKFLFMPLLLFNELILNSLFFLQLKLHVSLGLRLLLFLFLKDITSDNKALLHFLENSLHFLSFISLFFQLLICLIYDLLLLLLLLHQTLGLLLVWPVIFDLLNLFFHWGLGLGWLLFGWRQVFVKTDVNIVLDVSNHVIIFIFV